MNLPDIIAMHPYGAEIVAGLLAAISVLAFAGFVCTSRTTLAGETAVEGAFVKTKPVRGLLVSASCNWRTDQFQPHSEEGFVRWLCRECGEFGFTRSDVQGPVECKRMQRPAVL